MRCERYLRRNTCFLQTAHAMNWMARWFLCRYATEIGNLLLQGFEPAQRDKMSRTAEALDREPTIETFTFVAYDEGGMMIGPTGAHRLVCVADCGAKVVIFGHKGSLKNIDAILETGLPCIVQCETYPASQSANRYAGHTHWVWEYGMLKAASP